MSVDAVRTTPLGLVDDDLVACISCGLCLPHCPTYRVTGREIESPRGRITAMRAVESGAFTIDAAFVESMESCVQCRGCETACPASVPFGRLMEDTRAAIGPTGPWWRRVGEWLALSVVIPRHRLLLALSWVLAILVRVRLVPRRLGLDGLKLSAMVRPLDDVDHANPDVWLFTGCVMDAWMRDTHRSALALVRADGSVVATPRAGGDCCGALHTHSGRRAGARMLAERVMRSMPGEAPIVVDSAGCGAALGEYGHLLGTDEARHFSARVRDLGTWLLDREIRLSPTGRSVVVSDACHLRHVMGEHGALRSVLSRAYDVIDLDDEGLCCGAGGAYAALRPVRASEIRDRKVAAIGRAVEARAVVAVANPGCLLHLRGAGVNARHPADLLVEAMEPLDG